MGGSLPARMSTEEFLKQWNGRSTVLHILTVPDAFPANNISFSSSHPKEQTELPVSRSDVVADEGKENKDPAGTII